MANGEETHPRAGTTAAVESRVGRLEDQVARLAIDVAVIGQAQTNLTSLVTTQHTSILAQLTAIASDLRSFTVSASQQSAEPQATPAGRALVALISDRDRANAEARLVIAAEVAEAKAAADKALLWTVRAGGAVAVLLAMLTLFAPVVRQVLGIGS